jgi:hypothetical protein
MLPQLQQPNKTQITTQLQKQTHIKPTKKLNMQKNPQQQSKKQRNNPVGLKQVAPFSEIQKALFYPTETCPSRIATPSQENFKGTN